MEDSLNGNDEKRRLSRVGKFMRAANRKHRLALRSATNAVELAVEAGEMLAAARDKCRAGEWGEIVQSGFEGSLRTAQKYMRLARHWRLVAGEKRGALPSPQAEATKALTTILGGDGVAGGSGTGAGKRRARRVTIGSAKEVVQRTVEFLKQTERELLDVTPVHYLLRGAIDRIRAHVAQIAALIPEVPEAPNSSEAIANTQEL